MNLLTKIQNKTPEEKRKIIWTTIITVTVILGLLWLLTSRVKQGLPKDTTLWDTIAKGVKNAGTNIKNHNTTQDGQ